MNTPSPAALRDAARKAEASGDLAAAERELLQALTIDPGDGATVFALAEFLLRRGRYEEAEPLYGKLLAAFPKQPALLNSVAMLLSKTGRPSEAIELWARVHADNPTLAQPLVNIGLALRAANEGAGAIAQFQRALEVDPNLFEAHYQLGLTYFSARRREEAIASLEAALRIKPDHARAAVRLAQSYQNVCDWPAFDRLAPLLRREVDRALAGKPCAITPWFGLRLPLTRGERTAINAVTAAEYDAEAAPIRAGLGFARRFVPKDVLTVGYISPDYRRHPLLMLTASLYRLHDRARFRIHAYPLRPPDELGSEILRDSDKVVELSGLTAEAAARAIYDDGVDVLVDLSGYNQFARPEILALRPAPIQCMYLNPAAALGGKLYDCVIADPVIIPPEHEADYREPIERLPHSFFINDYRRTKIGPDSSRAAQGLPEDRFVFCCFSAPDKIEAPVFASWMNILRRCPDAVLWLFPGEARVIANLRRAAETAGIDPARLLFAQRAPHADHLARLKLADLQLDTYTYGAHMTGADGLWVGLPMLTRQGDALASRAGAMMLQLLDLPELVTTDVKAYEDEAVALAHNPQRLVGLRQRLLANRVTSPLFDAEHYVRGLEAIYQRLWEARVAGAPAEKRL